MEKLTDRDENILVSNVLSQAKCYLEAAGEFYPFGTVVNSEKEIKPISAYLGDEHPESDELLDFLEKAIVLGIKGTKYHFAAIAVDIFINDEENNQKSAIEIRIYAENGIKKKYFLCSLKDMSYYFTSYDI